LDVAQTSVREMLGQAIGEWLVRKGRGDDVEAPPGQAPREGREGLREAFPVRGDEVGAREPAHPAAPDLRVRAEAGHDLLGRHVPEATQRPQDLQISTLQVVQKHSRSAPSVLIPPTGFRCFPRTPFSLIASSLLLICYVCLCSSFLLHPFL